jgi:hypothetical protein
MLVKANKVPDTDLRFVMAVCSSYAYGDARHAGDNHGAPRG